MLNDDETELLDHLINNTAAIVNHLLNRGTEAIDAQEEVQKSSIWKLEKAATKSLINCLKEE